MKIKDIRVGETYVSVAGDPGLVRVLREGMWRRPDFGDRPFLPGVPARWGERRGLPALVVRENVYSGGERTVEETEDHVLLADLARRFSALDDKALSEALSRFSGEGAVIACLVSPTSIVSTLDDFNADAEIRAAVRESERSEEDRARSAVRDRIVSAAAARGVQIEVPELGRRGDTFLAQIAELLDSDHDG